MQRMTDASHFPTGYARFENASPDISARVFFCLDQCRDQRPRTPFLVGHISSDGNGTRRREADGKSLADGVRLGDMFGGAPGSAPGRWARSRAVDARVSAPGANDELLAGPHGSVLRQAIADRLNIQSFIGRMSDAERKMLPDVKGTADGLYERIAALAGALHRLDGEVGTDRLPALDERIAQIEGMPGDARDRERRLTLLRRQREMLAELVRSRAALAEQYESAGLLLQNLALDLLKVRSSGLDSALGGITSATQEARRCRARSAYVLDAADELREVSKGAGEVVVIPSSTRGHPERSGDSMPSWALQPSSSEAVPSPNASQILAFIAQDPTHARIRVFARYHPSLFRRPPRPRPTVRDRKIAIIRPHLKEVSIMRIVRISRLARRIDTDRSLPIADVHYHAERGT
jgi:hypothetical protein